MKAIPRCRMKDYKGFLGATALGFFTTLWRWKEENWKQRFGDLKEYHHKIGRFQLFSESFLYSHT